MCMSCFKFMCSTWIALLQDHITPIRNALHYLWIHPQVMKKWVKFCKSRNMRGIRFSCDVPTH